MTIPLYCFPLFVVLLFHTRSASAVPVSPYSSLISQLYNTVQTFQATQARTSSHEILFSKDIPCSKNSSATWKTNSYVIGQYDSDIHINFHGDEIMTLLRNKFAIPDTNFYVTGWVVQILLETAQLGAIDLDLQSMQRALAVLSSFEDKNKNSSTFIFWPQRYANGSFIASPPNLDADVSKEGAFAALLQKFLASVHLEWVWDLIKDAVDSPQSIAAAFEIPGDSDDTALGLAIGALLKQSKYASQLSSLWSQNVSTATATLFNYTYCPFSTDVVKNSIDPRTYFFLHEYLYKVQSEQGADPNFCLISTWTQNVEEQKVNYYKGVAMPFNTNNVDATVVANFLFGTSKQILSSFPLFENLSWFDVNAQRVYNNTVDYLCWVIDSEALLGRPDLGIPYYPPIMDFYWFTSRTLSALESFFSDNTVKKNAISDVLFSAYERLSQSLRVNGTSVLENLSQGNGTYWEDFLGDNDTSFGRKVEHHEDRLFTSAVAINALLDIWSFGVENGTARQWVGTVPANVKQLIESASAYLAQNVLTGELLPSNTFFSGSMKGLTEFPLYYPATYYEFLNGTYIDQSQALNPAVDSYSQFTLIGAVSGVMTESEFESQISSLETPIDWAGYGKDIYPYWSAPVITYACSMLTLAKVNSLLA